MYGTNELHIHIFAYTFYIKTRFICPAPLFFFALHQMFWHALCISQE